MKIPSSIKLASWISDENRAEIMRKIAALKPTKRKRATARKTSRDAIERMGLARLTDPAADRPGSARWIVRIYYRSAGGEILACDSEPLTRQAADTLRGQMHSTTSDALGADIMRADGLPHYASGDIDSWRRRELAGARVVVLPHQAMACCGGKIGDHADDCSLRPFAIVEAA